MFDWTASHTVAIHTHQACATPAVLLQHCCLDQRVWHVALGSSHHLVVLLGLRHALYERASAFTGPLANPTQERKLIFKQAQSCLKALRKGMETKPLSKQAGAATTASAGFVPDLQPVQHAAPAESTPLVANGPQAGDTDSAAACAAVLASNAAPAAPLSESRISSSDAQQPDEVAMENARSSSDSGAQTTDECSPAVKNSRSVAVASKPVASDTSSGLSPPLVQQTGLIKVGAYQPEAGIVGSIAAHRPAEGMIGAEALVTRERQDQGHAENQTQAQAQAQSQESGLDQGQAQGQIQESAPDQGQAQGQPQEHDLAQGKIQE